MKKSTLILYFTLFAVAISSVSCNKYLDVNEDPLNTTVSRADLILPAAQLYVGNALGDRLFRLTSTWAQYYTGGPGVSLGDWDKNTMATTDGNQAFNNLYRSMNNLSYIINKSGEPNYIGISKILLAYNLQVCADIFGDIPYNDALKGDIVDGFVISPKYDNAETVVYPAIEKIIKEGIAEFSKADANSLVPSADDIIYNGDIASWKKFANSLLLKVYLRQGSDDAKTKFQALYNTEKNSLITASDDNCAINYPGTNEARNPFWIQALSSIGNFYVGTTTSINVLKSFNDDRISYFYDAPSSGTHTGLKPGDVENSPASAEYSRPNGAKKTAGGVIFSPTAPVILLSSWETNFILCEAAARGWITASDESLYKDAITENFTYLGASIKDYLSTSGAFDATSLTTKIKSIAIQKWISMNGLQPVESWIETRRLDNTSNPLFASNGGLFQVPTQNVLGGKLFPSILFYPSTEQDLNKSFPSQHKLTDKVFWDK